jgi:hypothetical protein
VKADRPDADTPVVTITLGDIYARLCTLDDRLHDLDRKVDRLDVHGSQAVADATDHEARIRSLERWRYALPAGLVSGVLALALQVAARLYPT